jgi:conflict system STAND superfamily ATPase/sulfatase-modifying factor enzyme 1/effector-associated domain 8 (EAD8)-containing protein
MNLDRHTYKDFKTLLLGLPDWIDEAKRQVFVKDALWGHDALNHIVWREDGDTAATDLIETCAGFDAPTQGGKTPLCALLAQIRERGLAGGERASLVAALEQRLGCSARRTKWPYDPYPGLLALDHWQAPIFFGRTVETRELLQKLSTEQGRRFLLVTGCSGSGKSSLVRAGVWAMLEGGAAPNIPDSAQWLITAMFPSAQGGDPFLALTTSLTSDRRFGLLHPGAEAQALAADPGAFAGLLRRVLAMLPAGAEWLLILDQMEELFTPAAEALREPFLDLLLSAVARPGFRVMATIRSDFLDRCVDHPGLREVINRGGQYSVGRPGPLAMARMITGPVEEVDLGARMDVEPALVERMVADAVSEPGGLALLAFTLKELYRQSKASARLCLEVYCDPDFDGLKGVIGRLADAALARADAQAQAALPRVFSRLVTVREDGTATRRRERMDYWSADADALRLIALLSDAEGKGSAEEKNRLLVTGTEAEPTVEVAHEALLREWATLATWVEERRDALRLREQLEKEARAWNARQRPEHLRWRHERLAPARALLATADLLPELERDPLAADFATPEADWLLAALLCHATEHGRREDIGLRLAEIGDPRPGVGVIAGVPDMLWCEIPGGQVEMEGHESFPVAPFRMAAYPVTHAQFAAFIDATDGFDSDEWWEGVWLEKEAAVSFWRIRRHGNYPVIYVSWYDATAYCRWLSQRLGFEVRLPDECERKWAGQSARQDFSYPWGPEWREGLANTSEAGIGRTTAVGMYPGGRSLQGVYDLAGNVWEWCRNIYEEPRNAELGSDRSRVLRGGSWVGSQFGAHAVYRLDLPGSRVDYAGFRVVCASPIR